MVRRALPWVALGILSGCPSAPPNAPKPVAPAIRTLEPPATPEGRRAVQIAVSETHTCARMADGTVRCWGSNTGDELGDGTGVEAHIPVQVKYVTDAIDVVVGLSFSCARTKRGAVRCWGQPNFFTPEPGVERIWVRSGDGCERWPDGKTKCWGGDAGFLAAGRPGEYGTGPHPVVPALADATEISIYDMLGCARMKDATVRCFGRNGHGEVGDGTTVDRLEPVEVAGLAGIKQVAVGADFACALGEDGTVACWGANHAGQLGDGTTKEHHTPLPVPGLRDVVELAAGSLHTCARHADLTLACWGWNRDGQLGNGTTSDASLAPSPVVGLDRVAQVAAADTHTCAVHGDGDVACWGAGWRGVLGDGFQADRSRPVDVKWWLAPKRSAGLAAGVHVRTVAVGTSHSCAALDDGSVRCWGKNEEGAIAPGLDAALPDPVVVPNVGGAVTALSLDQGSAALLADGGLVAWGRGRPPARILAGVAQFAEGALGSCARFVDGHAACESMGIARDPVAHVTAVASSGSTACMLLEDRTVVCAGSNVHGQLGAGAGAPDRPTFAPVKGLRDVAQIALGVEHACARLADGSVTCWGEPPGAGRGDGVQGTPKPVAGLANAVDIAAGSGATCARLASGAVKCWGDYEHAQLGSDTQIAWSPVEVPWLRGARVIALGLLHSCALVADGSVLCWGENQHGELGDWTMDTRSAPKPVLW